MVPAQLPPTLLGKIIASNGKKCCDPRFGREQVVAGFVDLLGPHFITYGEDLPARVGEKRKFRFIGHAFGILRNRLKGGLEGVQILLRAPAKTRGVVH